jgi:hypothetical protein
MSNGTATDHHEILDTKKTYERAITIPANNAEVFKLREILNEQKEKKRALNKTNSMSRLVSSGFNGLNDNLYLTEPNNIRARSKKDKQTFSVFPEVEDKIEKEFDEEMININKGLQKKIDSIGYKQDESIRDFIGKTREIILMKYSVAIKKERVVRLKETYQNEIESIKDSMIAIKDAKKLFENEFFDKFEKYVKYLSQQRQKEKAEWEYLNECKNKLENDIKKLESYIHKQNARLEDLFEYQNFMQSIKEKTLISQQVKNIKTRLRRSGSLMRKESVLETRMYFTDEQELIDCLKNQEDENIKLLDKYNELTNVINDARKDLNRHVDDDKRIHDHVKSDILIKEKQLQELREKNKKLLEEKNRLLKEESEGRFYENEITKINGHKKSQVKSRLPEAKLMARICNVYNAALRYYDKFEKVDIQKENSKLYMLQQVEKVLTAVLKYDKPPSDTNSDYGKEHVKIKNELEYRRKLDKAVKLKEQEHLKWEKLKRDIQERNNKVYIMPKRRLAERSKPPEKKQITKNEKRVTDDMLFEEFISYDGNSFSNTTYI